MHGIYRIISGAGETPGNPKTNITADVLLMDFYTTFGKNAITVAEGDVTSSAGGEAAKANAIMGVGRITVSNNGTGYSNPIVTISGGGGSGAAATATGRLHHYRCFNRWRSFAGR